MNIYDRKILLVDDNRELLMMIRDTLRRSGYTRIVTAENVKEAVECFGKEEPDMAILDIMLPDGDGFTLFRGSGRRRTCRFCFCRRRMRITTGCSGWGWALTIISRSRFCHRSLCSGWEPY